MCQVSSVPVRSWSGFGSETYAGRSSTLTSDAFGNHRIVASSGDDLVRAREENFGGVRWLVVDVNDDRYRLPLSGPRSARSIAIDAGAGNDAVFVDPSVRFPLFINGGAGDDYLKGGVVPMALLGGAGDDTLIGGPSNDLLLGGGGRDVVHTGGGLDVTSMDNLYRKVLSGREGGCDKSVTSEGASQPPVVSLPTTVPHDAAPVPAQPQPVPVPAAPQPQPQQPTKVPTRPALPKPAPRPRLSDLMAAVDTHNENGFKSGRSMTKDMLASLYESPAKFRQTLGSMAGKGERDDAVASFLRALFDAGPGGAKLFREIPLQDKKTMAAYLGGGNSWNAQKKGLMLVMSKVTGTTDRNFGSDQQAQDYVRRYAGVM